MSGFINFIADPKVHDTALMSMAVSALLNALPKKAQDWHWTSIYDVPYNAVMGFWSLKTGQKPVSDPILPVAPAQPQGATK